MPQDAMPWVGYHKMTGVAKSQRYMDCIAVGYYAWLKSGGGGSAEGRFDVPNFFIDYSQGVQRAPWGLVPRSINQGSKIYSYQMDRVLSPEDPRAVCVVALG